VGVQVHEVQLNAYVVRQVDVVASRNAVDVSNYVSNAEWSLLSTNIQRHANAYPIGLCLHALPHRPPGGALQAVANPIGPGAGAAVYPDVTVSLYVGRRVVCYLVNIILPCVWLNHRHATPLHDVTTMTSSTTTAADATRGSTVSRHLAERTETPGCLRR